jgi:hypothetical protein
VQGRRQACRLDAARHLERDHRAHAVAEDREGQVELPAHGRQRGLHDLPEVREGRLAKTRLAARQLERADVDVRR